MDMYFGLNEDSDILNWDNQKVEPNVNMFPPPEKSSPKPTLFS